MTEEPLFLTATGPIHRSAFFPSRHLNNTSWYDPSPSRQLVEFSGLVRFLRVAPSLSIPVESREWLSSCVEITQGHWLDTGTFNDSREYIAVYNYPIISYLPPGAKSFFVHDVAGEHTLTPIRKSEVDSFILDFWAKRYPLQAIAGTGKWGASGK